MPHLPASVQTDVEAFDALHDDPNRWSALVSSIAAANGLPAVTPVAEGTVLVALAGRESVVKVYPPFLRDHFAFEAAVLERIHGRLSVPTPRLLSRGEHEGWLVLVMTQLGGEPLTGPWAGLDESRKCEVLHAIGRVAREVHALPVEGIADLAPPWEAFLARQRAMCRRRQARTGLPPHLLAQVEAFVAGEVPQGPPVILTGEYTPMNLMYGDGLAGMFDFGDGLVGPAAYDWLGPLCFLAAGHRERREAFFTGYGMEPAGEWRARLMRMLLLHRYSNLKAQIAVPGWDAARDFDELAAIAWP